MKVAIMQPYLFPYIGYFQLINEVDTFVSLDDVQYIKRGWINRNNILINGESKLFTFSVKKDSQTKTINERYYIMSKKEKEKFKKQIHFNYNKAKYFNQVIKVIDEIFEYTDLNVAKFNLNSIEIICRYIGIEYTFLESHTISKDNSLKNKDMIIDICHKLGAKIYINPIGGTELYNNTDFENNNIELFFIKNNSQKYEQLSENFIPNLSIIDVIMNNSKYEVRKLLNKYVLIKN